MSGCFLARLRSNVGTFDRVEARRLRDTGFWEGLFRLEGEDCICGEVALDPVCCGLVL